MAERAATSSRIAELTRRLEREPGSRIFLELAREHHAAGSRADAVRVCREGLKRNPAYHSARVLLGRILIEDGHFTEARPELEAVVQQSPDNLLARRLLGEALGGSGDIHAALEVFRGLLRLNPSDAEASAKLEELEKAASPPGVETVEVLTPPEVEDVAEERLPAVAPPPEAAPPVAAEDEIASRTTAALETPRFVEPAPERPLPWPAKGGGATIQVPLLRPRLAPPSASAVPPEPEHVPSAQAGVETVAMRIEPSLLEKPDEAPAPEAAPVPAPPIAGPPEQTATTAAAEAAIGLAAEPATLEPVEPDAEVESPPSLPGEEQEAPFTMIPTPTLAEIYLAQGMPAKALEIYRQVLAGDPQSQEIASRVEDLTRRLSPPGEDAGRRIAALKGWLERIRRAHDVQDHARRGGSKSPGM